jgi:predicted SAM-dependent methyltransferase
LKLNLGCNSIYLGDYVNVEVNPEFKADVYHDLREPLPFPSECAEEVLLSHVLEHLYYSDGAKLISEIHRVLKTGGLLRVNVPNMLWIAQLILTVEDHPLEKTSPFTLMYGMTNAYGAQDQSIWQTHRSGYTPKLLREKLSQFSKYEEEYVYHEIRAKAWK